jgi:hypothetical protein
MHHIADFGGEILVMNFPVRKTNVSWHFMRMFDGNLKWIIVPVDGIALLAMAWSNMPATSGAAATEVYADCVAALTKAASQLWISWKSPELPKKSIDFPLVKAAGLCMAHRPSELAERISNLREPTERIMFRLPVAAARVMAREIISQAPQDGYMAVVEQWRPLPNGQIELTMRCLRAAD